MDKQEDKEMRKPRRYGRFYALLGRLRGAEKEELALQVKLRAIMSKGGLRSPLPTSPRGGVVIPLAAMGNA